MYGEWFLRLPRRVKQGIAVLADCLALVVALWSALGLRLGEWMPDATAFWPAFLAAWLISIPAFVRLGLYRQILRYMGVRTILAVGKGATIGALAVFLVDYMLQLPGFPRSVPIIFWMLVMLYVGGSRFALYSWLRWREQQRGGAPAIIFGAGQLGVQLARTAAASHLRPVAFIDDDSALQGRFIENLRVHPRSALPDLLREFAVQKVLVALDPASVAHRRDILLFLEPFAVRVLVVPDSGEPWPNEVAGAQFRDVRIEDLLGRREIDPVPALLQQSVAGRNVMVTGAGGSIGTELCRQIVSLAPKRLVLLDQSELALQTVRRSVQTILARKQFSVPVVSVLGSVVRPQTVWHALSEHHIETLYHAAAYKHVGEVESNVIEGIRNNAFGTRCVAEQALAAGVKSMILISTDKAVRPRGVMGASKRLAELILQAYQEQADSITFSIVRFGNVLNSSGSVVPLFLDQIDHGGPVTVTHPEVTRYFMTLREAAQLVLQAANLAKGSEICVLDMGQPLKIVDLARRMAHLKGYSVRDSDYPEGDIEIQFTGLAPGEKLHEELLIGNDVSGTLHPRIMRVTEPYLPWAQLRPALDALESACESHDLADARRLLAMLTRSTASAASEAGGEHIATQVIALESHRTSG